MRFADVIGDPIAHSLSPTIHRHWLRTVGLDARFQASRVAAAELATFVDQRRHDRDWAGCSVTSPHKQAIIPLLDDVDEKARIAGAVNCVFRKAGALVGTNTDLDGLAQALNDIPFSCGKVVVVGAGGAARAALSHLRTREPGEIVLLARNRERAEPLLTERILFAELEHAIAAMAGARLVVNATPLGMTGAPPMPETLLSGLAAVAPGGAVMDMIYDPVETPLLAAARVRGLRTIDGLHMLIGQARPAFRRFFDAEPPEEDEELRALLLGKGR
jgi:shikimate dehydrogenase